MRHQVLKWAQFVFRIMIMIYFDFIIMLIFFWGGRGRGDFWSHADWLACCQYVIMSFGEERCTSEVCFVCLT